MKAEDITGEDGKRGKGKRKKEDKPCPFIFTLPIPPYPFPFYPLALILRPFFTFLFQRELLE